MSRTRQAISAATAWLLGEPMAELLELMHGTGTLQAFGADAWLHLNEELPGWVGPFLAGTLDDADVLRRTLAIERVAAEHFDFRGGEGAAYVERSQAGRATLDDRQRAEVLELADRLGLVTPHRPSSSRYDRTLVLGSGYRSPLHRARHAASLAREGVELGELAFLGSPRFLIDDPPEAPAVADFAPGAVDEFDLMVAAARDAFGLHPGPVVLVCGCADDAAACPGWASSELDVAGETPPQYTHEREVVLLDDDGRRAGIALSASTGRPPYRPETADTLAFWARRVQPAAGERVLLVTTQVFVPFQQFDALRTIYLPHGIEIETVGLGPEWGDRPQTAEYMLQETLSGIRSARRLLVAALEAEKGGHE